MVCNYERASGGKSGLFTFPELVEVVHLQNDALNPFSPKSLDHPVEC